MTLDEARAILGVARGAGHDEIRVAFRRRARQFHPDTHPTASAAELDELARRFDRAREARDILLLLPEGTASSEPSLAPTPRTAPAAPPRPAPRPAPAAPRRTPSGPSFHAHARTLRFDEFVQVVDAAGFGPGHRTPLHRDIPRIIAWSTVGILIAGLVGSIVWTSIVP